MYKNTFIAVVIISVLAGMLYLLQPTTDLALDYDQVTDPANVFTFKKPDDWVVLENNCGQVCTGDKNVQNFDYYKIFLSPREDESKIGVAIYLEIPPLHSTFDTLWTERTLDQFNTYEQLDINGNRAYYNKTDFVGPSDIEKYTDHNYVIEHQGNIVNVYFREKYSHEWGMGESIEASDYVRDFFSIVRSIRFLE
jgi:hypothetical protein